MAPGGVLTSSEHDALVLVGQEPRRDTGEQQGQRRDDDAVDQHVAAALSEHPLHARRVAAGAGVEDAVEPPEEAASFARWWPFWTGFRSVAHSAGVKTSATITDSAIAVAMVIENCR